PGRVTKKARAESDALRGRFWEAAESDLSVPRAMAVAWQAARSGLPGALKRELLLGFDAFLGLDLGAAQGPAVIPVSVTNRVSKRAELRRAGRYPEADAIRAKLRETGYELRDGATTEVRPLPAWRRHRAVISSS